ncbi:MAG: enoyl-CoA hydratase/isomerase family protein [Clostridia bacterium]|nr:enoyl-CoA hydratase/isomerase family protein [Clostridia bacterium]
MLRLNRPEVLNALNDAMFADLLRALDELEADAAVRAVLVTGEGRSFCSGGDVGAMTDERTGYQWYRYMSYRVGRLVQTLVNFPKPTVAAVNGHAVGAGMNLALACDLLVAADDARFSQIFVRVGLKPDFGGLYLLPRRVLSLPLAKELVFTGRMVDAEEALRLGFVNRVVPRERLLDEALALARQVAEGPAQAIQLSKAVLNRSLELDLDAVLQFEAMTHGFVKQSRDHREGVQAFREKRPPRFTGE